MIAVGGGGGFCTTKSTLQKELIVPFTSCKFKHGKGDLFSNQCSVPIGNSFSFNEYLPRAYQEAGNLLGVGDRDEEGNIPALPLRKVQVSGGGK